MQNVRVAIIGMGAVGATTFIYTVHSFVKEGNGAGAEIYCFDRSLRIGRGLAYATPHPYHILNMRAETMSIWPDRPADFVTWLMQHGESSTDYVPRHLFGQYIGERFEEALQLARAHGIAVHLVREDVDDCEENGAGVHISTAHGLYDCDQAFICPGHLPSIASDPVLKDNPRYLPSPWDLARLKEIPADARIGILGTSLTTVDALLSLQDAGMRGPITCFSRKRSLPKVQSKCPPVILKHLTVENIRTLTNDFSTKVPLDSMIGLLKADFLEFPGGAELWNEILEPPVNDTVAYLKKAIAQAHAGQENWHPIMDASTDVILYVWAYLDDEAKVKFIRQYESLWAMFRHSMPEVNAQRLLKFAESVPISVAPGLHQIDFDPFSQSFNMMVLNGPSLATKPVDYLIDARGTNVDLRRLDTPLIERMLRRGQLRQNPLGGVDVVFRTAQVIFANREPSERLRFMGIMTKGVHFYTNSYGMNRLAVEKAVENMNQTLQRRRSADEEH